MLSIFKNTAGDRTGAIDGLNLFFGALLGANLGTLDGLPLHEYVQLILVLAATVMSLRMLSISERRWMVLMWLGIYGVVLASMVLVPDFHPEGLATDDLHRLVATLAIWIGSAVMMEYWPVHQPTSAAGEPPENVTPQA